jgi:hypothetical protein
MDDPYKINWWTKKYKCLECGKEFMYCEEIGQLNCRYHDGVFKGGMWSCCGLKYNDITGGCRKKDHMHKNTSSKWYVFDVDSWDLVFKNIAKIKEVKKDSLIEVQKVGKSPFSCIRISDEISKDECLLNFDVYMKKQREFADKTK